MGLTGVMVPTTVYLDHFTVSPLLIHLNSCPMTVTSTTVTLLAGEPLASMKLEMACKVISSLTGPAVSSAKPKDNKVPDINGTSIQEHHKQLSAPELPTSKATQTSVQTSMLLLISHILSAQQKDGIKKKCKWSVTGVVMEHLEMKIIHLVLLLVVVRLTITLTLIQSTNVSLMILVQ